MSAGAAAESTRAATRWTTRLIPIFLTAVLGYATYVVSARICANLLRHSHRSSAIAILVIYLFFLVLTVASYLRTIFTIFLDPGVVPLGALALERNKTEREAKKQHSNGGLGNGTTRDIESRAYYAHPDPNPDSPGLELFYTQDVFVCESDGRPKWCSECCNWKPDRVHHSSEINRCVYRMDHFCPWVGGMIGENSFKFFVQFTFYTTCLCAVTIGAGAYVLNGQVEYGGKASPFLIVVLVLAGFFIIFTSIMFGASLRYVLLNMTNVDMLGSGSKVYQIAVRVPTGTRSTHAFNTVTYPLPKLELGIHGEANSHPRSPVANSHTTEITSGHRPRAIAAPRDAMAIRTFAILKTDPGENLWDLGYAANWRAIMGNNVFDWLLPARKSPCTRHDPPDNTGSIKNGPFPSFYPMGAVFRTVLARHGLAESKDEQPGGCGVEMSEIPRQG